MVFQKGQPKPKNAYSFPKGHKGYNSKPNSGSFKKGEARLSMPFSKEHKRKIGEANEGEKNYFWKGGKSKCIDCGQEVFNHSKRCRACYVKFNKGKNCLAWKGGITPKSIKIRQSIEGRLWREAVFARDSYTCHKCKEKGGLLNPHHIHNFADYPELRFAIDNGITFCEKCHLAFHKKYGKKNNTLKQLKEFLCL